MKTRTGFVSNSSSSSFIIAYKDSKDRCPTCGRSDTEIGTLKNVLEASSEDGWNTDGYDAVLSEAKDYGYDTSHLNKIQSRMSKLKNQGYEFAYISIGHYDRATVELVKNSRNIIVISEDSE